MEFLARVNPRYLAAIACFAAVKDVRYYLCGICIDPHPQGGVVIVATNGHLLGAIHDPDGFAKERIIIETPSGDWMKALKLKRHMRDFKPESCWISERCAVVTFSEPGDGSAPELFGNNVIVTARSQLIDARYPDYLKVIPKDEGDGAGFPWFQEGVLKPFLEAANILSPSLWAKPLHIRTRGANNPAVVRFEGEDDVLLQRFVGVAMPMTGKDFGPGNIGPDWLSTMDTRAPDEKSP